MDRLLRSQISRLRKGDIFYIKTSSSHVHKHNVPSDLPDNAAAAKNPFEGPIWIWVHGGQIDQTHWVRVLTTSGRMVESRVVGEQTCTHNKVMRGEDELVKIENEREEGIEWEGTQQETQDPKHNEVSKEGDVRGDKNDLLGGHL
jgi:hypothetical protein